MKWPSRQAAGSTPGSLRSQLLRWILIPLALLAVLDSVSVYRTALSAAERAYDRALLASTRALAERVSFVDGKVVADVPYVALDSFETDTLGRIYYKVTGIRGEFVSGYEDLPALPREVPRSDLYPALVHFYDASYRGEAVRVAALYQPVYDSSMRGIALIQVAETLNARLGLTRAILLDTLWRQAALIVAATLLVWFSVRVVLRPLMRLKNDVATRQPTDLSDFDPSLVHKEVRPLVLAMNGYMARLQILIDEQRRFIADASHQLRTPLTVLKTQAELALRESDPQALRQIVHSIGHTTESAVHLANRLLTLARAEHGVLASQMTAVPLAAIARQVGLELAPGAVRKNIDLSLDAQEDAVVTGNALLLHEMVVNLVDNAIRYTPPGGRVALRVSGAAHATLEVEDSGSGIPEAERSTVFTPFYRASGALEANPGGSGLGLAIVHDIAVLHGARLELSDGAGGQGLNIMVRFPPAKK
ncbi:MAG: sensor histidine kinase [Oxalobacteraceae bacterium]|nr:sensor histidine kinase [Oxalobacteraceae bacterium]